MEAQLGHSTKFPPPRRRTGALSLISGASQLFVAHCDKNPTPQAHHQMCLIDRLCNWDFKNLYVLHSFLFQAPCALNLHLQFWSTALVQGVVTLKIIIV